MKTPDGWIRGTACGKPYANTGAWVCVHCGRRADDVKGLCYPVKASVFHGGEQP